MTGTVLQAGSRVEVLLINGQKLDFQLGGHTLKGDQYEIDVYGTHERYVLPKSSVIYVRSYQNEESE